MQVNVSLRPEFDAIYDRFANDSIGLQLLEIEGIAPSQLDFGVNSYRFFNEKLADIASDSNSNALENISPANYRAFTSDGQMKLLGYFMWWHYAEKRYGLEFANEALSMFWDGSLYGHDAHGVRIQMPYCFAFSVDKIVFEGRPYGTSPNTPPKHRKSFLSQVDKLITDLSKDFAGATAPSDLLLWYAYFLKKDHPITPVELLKDEIINDLQGLVCLFNEPNRAEGEPPFTNIGLYDRIGLQSLFGHILYPDFTKPDLEYIMTIQRIFAEWFATGDPISGFPYRFPVVTANITTDEHNDFVDEESARWFIEVDRRLGNLNLHFGDKTKLAMCCRYENDLDDMDMSPDSFGNGGVNIGSHRVITLGIPRAARKANRDINVFYSELDKLFEVASKMLIVHRYDILQGRIDKNPEYLKFFGTLKWFNLKTMFSTFGITGIYEACEMMGFNILEDDGTEFVLDLLQYIKDKTKYYRKLHGIAFNVEEIPGEQACVTLVRKDRLVVDPHIPYEFYSNQYIPLTCTADAITRLELSGRFMKMVGGGGIVHENLDSPPDTAGKMYELVRYAVKCGVSHMAVNYRFGKCENGHTSIIGQTNKCPICGSTKIVRTRTRVIGYFSDEGNWHPVRRQFDAPNRYFAPVGGGYDEYFSGYFQMIFLFTD
jgi:ribonucleoside-triphosphate reductase